MAHLRHKFILSRLSPASGLLLPGLEPAMEFRTDGSTYEHDVVMDRGERSASATKSHPRSSATTSDTRRCPSRRTYPGNAANSWSVPEHTADYRHGADSLLLIQSRFQRKEAFLPQRKCIECGGELALAFSPSELASPTGQSDAARKPVPHWRCGLCGCTFSTEQLRAHRQIKKRLQGSESTCSGLSFNQTRLT